MSVPWSSLRVGLRNLAVVVLVLEVYAFLSGVLVGPPMRVAIAVDVFTGWVWVKYVVAEGVGQYLGGKLHRGALLLVLAWDLVGTIVSAQPNARMTLTALSIGLLAVVSWLAVGEGYQG